MRQIYIDQFGGCYHPCEVMSLRLNRFTGNRTIFFFDRKDLTYGYADVYYKDGSYSVGPIFYQSEASLLELIGTHFLTRLPVTDLPAFLPSHDYHRVGPMDTMALPVVPSSIEKHKKTEYLDVISYSDAVLGPRHNYFIIENMTPSYDAIAQNNGRFTYGPRFHYIARALPKYNKPPTEDIIAVHRTLKPITAFFKVKDKYLFTFDDNPILDCHFRQEQVIIKRIIELNKQKRPNMDTELLTRIVRLIIKEERDYYNYALYENYLKKYYDPEIKRRTLRNKQ